MNKKIFSFFYGLSFACLRTNTRNAMPTMTDCHSIKQKRWRIHSPAFTTPCELGFARRKKMLFNITEST